MVNLVQVSERPPDAREQKGARADAFIEQHGGEGVLHLQDASRTIRLFDIVDFTWTAPLPAEYAQAYYLRKLVVKCSACKWTTGSKLNSIDGHLKQLRENHEGHLEAQPQIVPAEMGGTRIICSGCPVSFKDVVAWKRHMIQFNAEILEQHRSAVPQAINRFVLEQPPVSNETSYVLSEPESAQVARSQRPAGTRRRRGRRGRGGR